MTDYFALLDEPRRPWLDADALQKKFRALSAQTHPDHTTGSSAAEKESATRGFTELNAAFTCLREPKDRLRHLLELESGAKLSDVHEIPSDLANLFMEVARLRREAGDFLSERAQITSPLLRVPLFERAEEWIERLREMQRRVGERQSALANELQVLDGQWQRLDVTPGERRKILSRLEEIYRLLSFYNRWNLQLQETIVQLTL